MKNMVRLFLDYCVVPFQPASTSVIVRRIRFVSLTTVAIFMLWLLGFGTVHLWVRYFNERPQSRWYREPANQNSGIVIIVHGWTKGPEDMLEVAEIVKSNPNYDQDGIYLWAYEADRFSNKDPVALAHNLASRIAELHREASGDIVLIGHSLGGLVIRRAFLIDLDDTKQWSPSVRRIVLLAAPNRGTEATSRSPWLWVGDGLAKSFRVGELIRSVYRGAPFIVDLRIDWIKRFQKLKNPPLVAQIVGSKDNLVSSSDSIDVLQFPNSIDRHLANSTHESIVRKDEAGVYIREALVAQRDDRGTQMADRNSVLKLLLVHGIRDYGERFDQIRDAVKALAIQRNISLQASSPRYKYFSALQFINPLSRWHKIYEFADLYTEMLATPPVDAPIYFVGHSFGTYLMGKSTEYYKSMEFDRVYLAGSVLREDFFAKHNLLGNRIKWVRNDIAAKDWPVGILCSGLDGLGLAEDVGTGGFNGFSGIVREDRYEEFRLFDGGHGEALTLTNRPTIAAWLLQGRISSFDHTQVKEMLVRAKVLVQSRAYLWELTSRAAPGLFVAFIALITYLLLIGKRPFVALGEILFVMWFLNII